jgi:ABC-type transporter Mla maintaining outer membrane lipid asymmetry ATPase subunit MlaF
VTDTEAVLRIDKITKAYHGLRPLRIASLVLMPGERVSISGVDAAAAELLVSLITGAALPDEGHVWTFGTRTADIADADQWLSWLDQFGIVSERGVLLESATLLQNLALPFTLEIDPVPADVQQRVEQLARECALPVAALTTVVGELSAEVRVRAHLARAIAMSPKLLIVEHPTARVADTERGTLAADIARVCDARHLAALAITNDDRFANALTARTLKLDAATGELRPLKRGWFSR